MSRRMTSLCLLVSGFLLLITSLVLYIEPHGRVAYWSNWSLLGLSKQQWDAMHINVGLLFLVSGVVHSVLNWRFIVDYSVRSVRRGSALPLGAALVLTAYVAAASVVNIFPANLVMDFNKYVKSWQSDRLGEPPFGHAELVPLGQLARFSGVPVENAIRALREAGVKGVTRSKNLKSLALENRTTPQRLFEILLSSKKEGAAGLPPLPPPGTGKLSLSQICVKYRVNCGEIMERLSGRGLKVEGEIDTLEAIAGRNGITPMEVYHAMRGE